MKKTTPLGLFVTGLSLTLSVCAHATEWYQGSPSFRNHTNHPTTAASTYLQKHSSQLRLESVQLETKRVLPLRSLHTVRFAQHHHNLPVIGKYAVVRVGPEGSVRVVALDVARGLRVDPQPTLTANDAIAEVAAALHVPLPPPLAHASLVVLAEEPSDEMLAWQVDTVQPYGMHRFFVDAHRGGVVAHRSMARHALGRVFDVNPIVTPNLVERELIGLSPAVPTSLTGFEEALRVHAYVAGDIMYGGLQTNQTPPSEGEDFLFTPNFDPWGGNDPFGEVMGYYHAARIRGFFENNLGVDMSGSEFSLAVITGYAPESSPEYIQNAFYSPWPPNYPGIPGNPRNIICLGRGYSENLAHDSDVLLHEFTHYMSHNALDYTSSSLFDAYGYVSMPDAINEGTADYFSSSLNNDPQVGEYALGAWARNLDEPAGRCPENMIGESHEDGRIIGNLTWTLRNMHGADKADQLVWGAMSLLGSRATFGDFGRGLLQSAADLNFDDQQIQQIENELKDRGLDDCDRALEINGKPRVSYMLGLGELGSMMGYSCADMKASGFIMSSLFQYQYTPHPTDSSLTLDVRFSNAHGGSHDMNWRIVVQRNRMAVVHSNLLVSPDYMLNPITDTHAQLVIDADSTPPFDPSATYYAAILSENCWGASLHVEANPPETPPADAGADVAPEAEAKDAGWDIDLVFDTAAPPEPSMTPELYPAGGCSCHTSPAAPSARWWWLIATSVLCVARRRPAPSRIRPRS
ncbi:MAG TPA: hypothetical protein PKL73_20180 [Polyangiaceae bacterium]|jgi:hypothetical protein|nr:MAG: hypothetical protein BWY17_01738 [Deltaproteobacteria bacterium ADurb.Bin207]HNS99288.1 hypothetical protein [Polyangiaceae bacterium]HNZ23982.1 hypothetical protein [Polyangiaceae bacterium]HOD21767.1 hypothetical protein [Polyangiaceae bacterium]HOE49477.1 hypothetical protein [Polyangiaceae bacterium]